MEYSDLHANVDVNTAKITLALLISLHPYYMIAIEEFNSQKIYLFLFDPSSFNPKHTPPPSLHFYSPFRLPLKAKVHCYWRPSE